MKKFLIVTAVILLPLQASAASLGELLRTSFSLPYVVGYENRQAFPDELTVSSWDNPVAPEVDISVLSEKSLTGIIPLQWNSHLVRFGEDPKVYAVGEDGQLHWLLNEEVASVLYGQNWNQRVISLYESYLSNYTQGATLASVQHMEGTLFKHETNPTVYYLQDGIARPFLSEQAFYDNGFSFKSVVTVQDSIQYHVDYPIAGYDPTLH